MDSHSSLETNPYIGDGMQGETESSPPHSMKQNSNHEVEEVEGSSLVVPSSQNRNTNIQHIHTGSHETIISSSSTSDRLGALKQSNETDKESRGVDVVQQNRSHDLDNLFSTVEDKKKDRAQKREDVGRGMEGSSPSSRVDPERYDLAVEAPHMENIIPPRTLHPRSRTTASSLDGIVDSLHSDPQETRALRPTINADAFLSATHPTISASSSDVLRKALSSPPTPIKFNDHDDFLLGAVERQRARKQRAKVALETALSNVSSLSVSAPTGGAAAMNAFLMDPIGTTRKSKHNGTDTSSVPHITSQKVADKYQIPSASHSTSSQPFHTIPAYDPASRSETIASNATPNMHFSQNPSFRSHGVESASADDHMFRDDDEDLPPSLKSPFGPNPKGETKIRPRQYTESPFDDLPGNVTGARKTLVNHSVISVIPIPDTHGRPLFQMTSEDAPTRDGDHPTLGGSPSTPLHYINTLRDDSNAPNFDTSASMVAGEKPGSFCMFPAAGMTRGSIESAPLVLPVSPPPIGVEGSTGQLSTTWNNMFRSIQDGSVDGQMTCSDYNEERDGVARDVPLDFAVSSVATESVMATSGGFDPSYASRSAGFSPFGSSGSPTQSGIGPYVLGRNRGRRSESNSSSVLHHITPINSMYHESTTGMSSSPNPLSNVYPRGVLSVETSGNGLSPRNRLVKDSYGSTLFSSSTGGGEHSPFGEGQNLVEHVQGSLGATTITTSNEGSHNQSTTSKADGGEVQREPLAKHSSRDNFLAHTDAGKQRRKQRKERSGFAATTRTTYEDDVNTSSNASATSQSVAAAYATFGPLRSVGNRGQRYTSISASSGASGGQGISPPQSDNGVGSWNASGTQRERSSWHGSLDTYQPRMGSSPMAQLHLDGNAGAAAATNSSRGNTGTDRVFTAQGFGSQLYANNPNQIGTIIDDSGPRSRVWYLHRILRLAFARAVAHMSKEDGTSNSQPNTTGGDTDELLRVSSNLSSCKMSTNGTPLVVSTPPLTALSSTNASIFCAPPDGIVSKPDTSNQKQQQQQQQPCGSANDSRFKHQQQQQQLPAVPRMVEWYYASSESSGSSSPEMSPALSPAPSMPSSPLGNNSSLSSALTPPKWLSPITPPTSFPTGGGGGSGSRTKDTASGDRKEGGGNNVDAPIWSSSGTMLAATLFSFKTASEYGLLQPPAATAAAAAAAVAAAQAAQAAQAAAAAAAAKCASEKSAAEAIASANSALFFRNTNDAAMQRAVNETYHLHFHCKDNEPKMSVGASCTRQLPAAMVDDGNTNTDMLTSFLGSTVARQQMNSVSGATTPKKSVPLLPVGKNREDEVRVSFHAPVVFSQIRTLLEFDDANFQKSLSYATWRRAQSPGKSDAGMFYFGDYVLKQVKESEFEFLRRKFLPSYATYCEKNPHTLLSRFYALFTVEWLRKGVTPQSDTSNSNSRSVSPSARGGEAYRAHSDYGEGGAWNRSPREMSNNTPCTDPHASYVPYGGQKDRYILMQNVFATQQYISSVYDLKGSTVGRTASTSGTRTAFGARVLKDNDLPDQVILCGPLQRAVMLAQLRSDTMFLNSLQIVDYSFLVGVRSRVFSRTDRPSRTVMGNTTTKTYTACRRKSRSLAKLARDAKRKTEAQRSAFTLSIPITDPTSTSTSTSPTPTPTRATTKVPPLDTASASNTLGVTSDLRIRINSQSASFAHPDRSSDLTSVAHDRKLSDTMITPFTANTRAVSPSTSMCGDGDDCARLSPSSPLWLPSPRVVRAWSAIHMNPDGDTNAEEEEGNERGKEIVSSSNTATEAGTTSTTLSEKNTIPSIVVEGAQERDGDGNGGREMRKNSFNRPNEEEAHQTGTETGTEEEVNVSGGERVHENPDGDDTHDDDDDDDDDFSSDDDEDDSIYSEDDDEEEDEDDSVDDDDDEDPLSHTQRDDIINSNGKHLRPRHPHPHNHHHNSEHHGRGRRRNSPSPPSLESTLRSANNTTRSSHRKHNSSFNASFSGTNVCSGRCLTGCDGGLLSLPVYAEDDPTSAREDVYYIGLIDILQTYTPAKRIENFAKGFVSDRHQISVVPPKEYAERLSKLVERITC